MVGGVIHVLAHFEMSLAPAGERVVERVRQASQIVLRQKRTGNVTQRLDDAQVLPGPNPFPKSEWYPLFLEMKFVQQPLLELPPRCIRMRCVQALPFCRV